MPRPTPKLRSLRGFPGATSDPSIDPAWQPWVQLVRITLAEANDPAWSSVVQSSAERPATGPLLQGATLRVDAKRTRAQFLHLAQAIPLTRVTLADVLAIIRAAIAYDDETLARFADRAGVSAPALAIIAQLATLPVLCACWRELAAQVPPSFQRGWCPVCGAWPELAEMRGIERRRRLRCGRCLADWSLPVLRCAFCGEMDHRRLGSLVVEGQEQNDRVETCDSCHGYLKTVATLGALSSADLSFRDGETVPLDLAAQERGYARPTRPAFTVNVTLVT